MTATILEALTADPAEIRAFLECARNSWAHVADVDLRFRSHAAREELAVPLRDFWQLDSELLEAWKHDIRAQAFDRALAGVDWGRVADLILIEAHLPGYVPLPAAVTRAQELERVLELARAV